MTFASLTEALRRVALFQDLQPQQLIEIARRADRVIFKPGDTIIANGQTGDGAFLIVSGAAVRTTGPGLKEQTEPLGPGTLIGEMAMLVETEHTSTVTCTEPVRALKVARASLLDQMANDLDLANHFVEKLVSRLKELATDLKKVDETLAAAGRFSPSKSTPRETRSLASPAPSVA